MNYCKGCKYAGLDGMDCYSCSKGSNYVPNELESYKKEIAELKKDLINSNERLIKAKNLLTRFVMGSVYFNGKETNLVEEAEQFLKEE